ncbi:hypothetical protein Tsp_05857 [Trichinella spiralis]|uniref:hypothetical protein n=1 Tax=Trichinella spiralis TaxID=6334 RepID=UPI0001EFC3D3|nr:hypothetical protein Tsp_05857 [Trichinella spiralis]
MRRAHCVFILKTADDLGAIPSLSNRRSMLEQSQEGRVERKSQIDVDLTQAGKVKDKLSRYDGDILCRLGQMWSDFIQQNESSSTLYNFFDFLFIIHAIVLFGPIDRANGRIELHKMNKQNRLRS